MRETMSAQVGRARATLRGYMDQIPGQRINIHWQNEINADAEGQFRFYFQNPNGLMMDPMMMTQDLQMMKEFDVSCFGFAETNLAWNKPHIAMQYKQLQRKVWLQDRGVKTTMSSMQLETQSNYQQGGMAMSVVGKWTSRTTTTEQDPSGMGRWCSITLIGKEGKLLTLITAYQCNQSKSGDNTMWSMEKIMLGTKFGRK